MNRSTCCSGNTTKKPHISWGRRSPRHGNNTIWEGHTRECLLASLKTTKKEKKKKHNYTSETGRVFCSPAGIWISRAGGGAESGVACWSELASRVDTAPHHSDPDMGEQVTEVVQKRLNQSTCCSENTTKKPHISWGPRTPSRKQHFWGENTLWHACLRR